MKQKEFRIEAEEPEITCSTTYWHLYLTINDKNVEVSKWVSFDDNIGETDNGIEIVNGDLTEEEEEAVKEHCEENIKWM